MQICNQCVFFQCQMPIKKLTVSHTKIIILTTNPSEDDKQGHRRSITLECKHEFITKIENCHAFSASLDKTCQLMEKAVG